MSAVTKLKLHNFKRFDDLTVEFKENINVLIGDNESGKSTLLTALDYALSGSDHRVRNAGIEHLFNTRCIADFFESARGFENLPTMWVEVYFDEQSNHRLNGENNSDGVCCDGIKLICEPASHYCDEITEVLTESGDHFPFEYYSIKFKTFSGEAYSGYRRVLKHLLIDSSQLNNDYATREYVKDVYKVSTDTKQRHLHQLEFRRAKSTFKNTHLCSLNDGIEAYDFSLRTGGKASLENELTIVEDEVQIEHRGKGRQSLIKTEFALNRAGVIDLVLLEEPENHLSHGSMKKMIQEFTKKTERQLILTTHSSLFTARLGLENCIFLGSTGVSAALADVAPDTQAFFKKAPENNLLQLVLSKKVILVEGDAEFILMEQLYKNVRDKLPEEDDVHIISVGGTSFKRYLDVARTIDIKVAVIRDNDGDYTQNCAERYAAYTEDFLRVFADIDDQVYTFEVAMYRNNLSKCEEFFSGERITLPAVEHMLSNKTKVALRLLTDVGDDLVVPAYIREAITWLVE